MTGRSNPKLTEGHLARKAVVYLRQSSPGQVKRNQESQRLQYDLGHGQWAVAHRADRDIDGENAPQKLLPGQRLPTTVAFIASGLGLLLCVASSGDMASYKDKASRGFKRFFGASEGIQYWDSITLKNNSPQAWYDAMIYQFCVDGRAEVLWTWTRGDGHIEIYRNTEPAAVAHELGHHILLLGDEYRNDSQIECGHSLMATSGHEVTNLCYCNNWHSGSPDGMGRCVYPHGNHNLDPNPVGTPASNEGPAWWNLAGRVPGATIYETPDNYSYEDFDFNGLYGKVTIQ